jgi:hypothetical protein
LRLAFGFKQHAAIAPTLPGSVFVGHKRRIGLNHGDLQAQ